MAEGARGVYSPDAGILNATKCVQAMVARTAAHGGVVRDREAVQRIHADTNGVTVTTDKGAYRAARLIIAAGAWMNRMLHHIGISLPLEVVQEQVVHFKPLRNAHAFAPDKFPIWIHHHEPPGTYGFPIMGLPGLKLGFHQEGYVVNVDEYTATARAVVTERLRAYLARALPDAAGEPFNATACLYTNTPDQNFIVDTVPHLPNVAIASACSGHGFKFAMGIGRALADLVMCGATEMPIAHIRTLGRYLKKD